MNTACYGPKRGHKCASPALGEWTRGKFQRESPPQAGAVVALRSNLRNAQVAAARLRHAERHGGTTKPLEGNFRCALHAS